MTVARYLMSLFKAMLVFFWGATTAAVAATVTQSPIAIELDPVMAGLCVIVSSLAGATALALRMDALLRVAPDKPFVRPWLFVCAHMGGSWTAAIMAFILGKANGTGVWGILLGVLVCSFLGARAIEMMAEKWLAGVKLPPDAGTATKTSP